MIIGTLLALFSSVSLATQTKIVHISGIDADPRNNGSELLTTASSIADYCRTNSSETSCSFLYFKNSSYYMASAEQFQDLAQKTQAILPKRENFEESVKNALSSAKSGDQVVISLAGHGENTFTSQSCIQLNPDESFCADDLEKLIKENQKKGTKVLVVANGCFTGGFSNLSSENVCTLVSSSSSRATARGQMIDIFRFASNKSTKERLSLSDLAHAFQNSAFAIDHGGGFSSQVISRNICSEKNKLSLNEAKDLQQKLATSKGLLKDLRSLNDLQAEECRSNPSILNNQIETLKKFREIFIASFYLENLSPYFKKNCSEDDSSDQCKLATTLITNISEILKLMSEVEKEIAAAEKKEQVLFRKSEVDKDNRNQYLKELSELHTATSEKITAIFKSDKYKAIMANVIDLAEKTCFPLRDLLPVDLGDKLMPSNMSSDGPTTEKALEEARKCEASFLL